MIWNNYTNAELMKIFNSSGICKTIYHSGGLLIVIWNKTMTKFWNPFEKLSSF